MYKRDRDGQKKLFKTEQEAWIKQSSPAGKNYISAMLSFAFFLMLTLGCLLIYASIFPVEGNFKDTFFVLAAAGFFLYAIYFPQSGVFPHRHARYKRWYSRMWIRHLGVAVCFAVGYGVFHDVIHKGMLLIANEYILKCNYYYGTRNALFPEEWIGDGGNREAVLFILLLIMWWEAAALFRWKKAWAILVPSVLIFAAELLIGLAPNFGAMVVLLTGFLGILPFCQNISDAMLQVKVSLLLGGMGLICVLAASFLGTETAEGLLANQKQVLAYQHSLEDWIMEWDFPGIFGSKPGRISNAAPKYKEQAVMEVTVDYLPEANVYLRGFVGDTYQNGTWLNTGGTEFAENVAGWPEMYQRDTEGLAILNLPYDSCDIHAWPGNDQMNYGITYLDTDHDYAYLPYYVDLNGVLDRGGKPYEVSIESDMIIFRNKADYLSVNGFRRNLCDTGMIYEQNNRQENIKLYESDLSRFLTVPDDLKQVRALGSKLQADLDQKMEELTLTMESGEQEVYVGRLAGVRSAELVRKELFSRTSYSLDLNPVPMGEDAVEYFLFQSGEGFCQHYASAGTMLLRETGIPARYVTGYVIYKDDFKPRGDGTFQTVVKDSDAHAWAEIYVYGLGWIPFDMTKGPQSESGYEEEDKETAGSNGRKEAGEQSQNDEDELQSNSESKKIQTEEKNDPNYQIKDAKLPLQNKNAGNPSMEKGVHEASGTTNGEKKDQSSAAAILLFGLGFGCAAAVVLRNRILVLRNGRGRRIVPDKTADYRLRIRKTSARIYRIMRKQGKIREKNLDDQAFYEELKINYWELDEEELERYIEILQRTAYSDQKVSEKDAAFCDRLLKKLKLLK